MIDREFLPAAFNDTSDEPAMRNGENLMQYIQLIHKVALDRIEIKSLSICMIHSFFFLRDINELDGDVHAEEQLTLLLADQLQLPRTSGVMFCFIVLKDKLGQTVQFVTSGQQKVVVPFLHVVLPVEPTHQCFLAFQEQNLISQ